MIDKDLEDVRGNLRDIAQLNEVAYKCRQGINNAIILINSILEKYEKKKK